VPVVVERYEEALTGQPFREEVGSSLQKWDGARELWAAAVEVFRLGLL